MTKRIFLPTLASIFDYGYSASSPFSSNRCCENESSNYTIEEKENEYVIEMNVAGVKKEDIEIGIKDEKLSIIALRKREIKEGDEVKESIISKYEESFRLNNNTVNLDQIEANLEDGILTVRITKKEEIKYERQIAVS